MFNIGQILPEKIVYITRAGVVRYAGASTDFNQIHYSDRKAKELGLPGVLAHGMWTMGAALAVVTDVIEPSRIISYTVRFTNPVVVPDNDEGAEIKFSGEVTEIIDGVATIKLTAVFDEKPVLGNAKVKVKID